MTNEKAKNLICQNVSKEHIHEHKTNDKGLLYLTYKELIQNINDQRFKKEEKMFSLVKEMGIKIQERSSFSSQQIIKFCSYPLQ